MTPKSPDTSAIRTAIFPGSFNPFTVGHASIVERALTLFDHIIICVGYNLSKEADAAGRASACADRINALYSDNPRVEAIADAGLTADIARRYDARCIIRGIRSVADFEYERNMADINREISGIETIFLPTLPGLACVSSSMVRELEHFGVDVSRYIPR